MQRNSHTLELWWWRRVWRWFALAPQTIIHTNIHTVRMCVCVYLYICCLFTFLSIPDSCLPNSLFLFDTGLFCWTETSCRPCQQAFFLGFRFGEFECFSWLFTEYCTLKASGYTDIHVQTSRRRCDGVFFPHDTKHTHLNTDVKKKSKKNYIYIEDVVLSPNVIHVNVRNYFVCLLTSRSWGRRRCLTATTSDC